MARLEEILNLLPQLDESEAEQVRRRLQHRMQKGSAAAPAPVELEPLDSASDEHLMLEEIAAFLRKREQEFVSVALLRRSSVYGSFKEKVPGVMSFVRLATKDRAKQRSFIEMGLGMLYKMLLDREMSPGSRTIMAHIHRFPSVVNQAFPGYAAMGMLSMLVDRPIVHKEPED